MAEALRGSHRVPASFSAQPLLLPSRVLISAGVGLSCCDTVPRTGGHGPGALKQQKHILSQSWRLEVQAQGVSRVGFFRGVSSRLTGAHLPPVPWWCPPSVSSSPFLTRTLSPIGLGSTLIASFSLFKKKFYWSIVALQCC